MLKSNLTNSIERFIEKYNNLQNAKEKDDGILTISYGLFLGIILIIVSLPMIYTSIDESWKIISYSILFIGVIFVVLLPIWILHNIRRLEATRENIVTMKLQAILSGVNHKQNIIDEILAANQYLLEIITRLKEEKKYNN